MSERLDLTVPIVSVSRTTYRIVRLVLDWEAPRIQIILRGSDGIEVYTGYSDDQAVGLMTILNTVNLSVVSLHKRVLQRLVLDGKLPAGSVSGTPE